MLECLAAPKGTKGSPAKQLTRARHSWELAIQKEITSKSMLKKFVTEQRCWLFHISQLIFTFVLHQNNVKNGLLEFHRCGGSILNENWVLSAGHCCEGIIGSGDVVAGGVDIYFPEGVEQHRSITKFKNPDYDSGTIDGDFCLLKVDKPFEFNDEIKAIGLDSNLNWEDGSVFMVSGWGTKSVTWVSNLPEFWTLSLSIAQIQI